MPEANENNGAETAKPMQLVRLERSVTRSSPVWKGDIRGISGSFSLPVELHRREEGKMGWVRPASELLCLATLEAFFELMFRVLRRLQIHLQ
jgi:hypothetical protein